MSPRRLRIVTTIALTVMLPLVASAQSCIAPASGLVSWWAAEGNAADAADGNNGSLVNGATFAAGEVGQAFSLPGSNAAVVVPNSSSLNITGSAITVSMWAKGGAQAANGYLLSKSNFGGTNGYSMYTGGTSTLQFFVGTTSGGQFTSNFGFVWDNQWHLLTGVYTGTTIALYVDSVLKTSSAASGTIQDSSAQSLNLGRWNGGNFLYVGLLDEVQIYNRALSQSEITAIYQAGTAGECSIHCGDGVVGAHEQCDDGNTVSGDCCSAACQFEAAGSACTSDANPCTTDLCNGSGTCVHAAGNAGAVCRASAGPCDVAESCNGTSTACPADALASSTTICRSAAGECDLVENCTGSSAACPSDAKKSNGTACTDDGNPCTTDTCDGTNVTCQHALGNAGIICRAAANECDLAETCTGCGSFVTKWGSVGSGDGQFNNVTGVAVDASGNVFVSEFDGNRVQKFTNTGTFVSKWGTAGSGDGQFNQPYSVAVDGSGNVFVLERANARVQKFTNSGTFIAKWGSGGGGDGQFNLPTRIAVDASGNVYVSDSGNDRVQKFTNSGTFLTKWGSFGTGDGQFDAPTGIAVDTSGNVFVGEFSNNRVQKFTHRRVPRQVGKLGQR